MHFSSRVVHSPERPRVALDSEFLDFALRTYNAFLLGRLFVHDVELVEVEVYLLRYFSAAHDLNVLEQLSWAGLEPGEVKQSL